MLRLIHKVRYYTSFAQVLPNRSRAANKKRRKQMSRFPFWSPLRFHAMVNGVQHVSKLSEPYHIYVLIFGRSG